MRGSQKPLYFNVEYQRNRQSTGILFQDRDAIVAHQPTAAGQSKNVPQEETTPTTVKYPTPNLRLMTPFKPAPLGTGTEILLMRFLNTVA